MPAGTVLRKHFTDYFLPLNVFSNLSHFRTKIFSKNIVQFFFGTNLSVKVFTLKPYPMNFQNEKVFFKNVFLWQHHKILCKKKKKLNGQLDLFMFKFSGYSKSKFSLTHEI